MSTLLLLVIIRGGDVRVVIVILTLRSFEKGLAGRGGWREEILPVPEIQTSFLCPFSYATLRRKGSTILGINSRSILAPLHRQLPPTNPFSKSLTLVNEGFGNDF